MRAKALLAVAAATLVWGCGSSDARDEVMVERDVRYAGPRGPALDVYRTDGGGPARPAVLAVHGGSWVAGDKGDVAPTALALANSGFVVFAVGYDLAGPARAGFPRQLRQVRAATRFVRRNAGRYGVDRRRVGALGISAGAHLAALAGVTGRGPLTRGARLGAIVSWSGPFDLRPPRLRVLSREIPWFLGCRDCPRRAARASPLVHVSADDPPTLIVNSTEELIPASQARRMARRLRAAGVPAPLLLLPGALHAPLFEPLTIGPAVRFLRRRLG
jgi:acetyl esterase/lipase